MRKGANGKKIANLTGEHQNKAIMRCSKRIIKGSESRNEIKIHALFDIFEIFIPYP